MEKWYFVVYEHKYISKTTGYDQSWSYHEKIIHEHPISFIRNMRSKYGEDDHACYEYRLKFWKEIPEEIALKYHDNTLGE